MDSRTARRRIRNIIDNGVVVWTEHVMRRLAERQLTTVDCVNVLRAGQVGVPEFDGRTWRYPVSGGWITVVVAFRSELKLVVITAWRSDPLRG